MNVHDMLQDVHRATIKADKIKRLRDHDSPELRSLLKSSYDPNIEWFIPEGEVPYTPNTDKTGHAKLMTKIPQIEKLVCNHSTKMGVSDTTAQFKREKLRSKRGPLDTTAAKDQKRQKRKKARKARRRNRR